MARRGISVVGLVVSPTWFNKSSSSGISSTMHDDGRAARLSSGEVTILEPWRGLTVGRYVTPSESRCGADPQRLGCCEPRFPVVSSKAAGDGAWTRRRRCWKLDVMATRRRSDRRLDENLEQSCTCDKCCILANTDMYVKCANTLRDVGY